MTIGAVVSGAAVGPQGCPGLLSALEQSQWCSQEPGEAMVGYTQPPSCGVDEQAALHNWYWRDLYCLSAHGQCDSQASRFMELYLCSTCRYLAQIRRYAVPGGAPPLPDACHQASQRISVPPAVIPTPNPTWKSCLNNGGKRLHQE